MNKTNRFQKRFATFLLLLAVFAAGLWLAHSGKIDAFAGELSSKNIISMTDSEKEAAFDRNADALAFELNKLQPGN